MADVAVVTDSTCYLPAELAESVPLEVVPVSVIVSGHSYLDGVEITPTEVARALSQYKPVTTSRPSPAQFLDVYEKLAANGAEHIVSVHLSSALSGTYDAALLAARDATASVTVVDSRTVAMGLGFSAVNAARAAAAGEDVGTVVEIAERTAANSHVLFYVNSLEFLRRGGRIGHASAFLGTALRVKPLLHVVDGEVAPLEKARTAARALARLEDIAAEYAQDGEVQMAVQHLQSQDRADQLAHRLQSHTQRPVLVAEVGAVMGVHVGPGLVAVSVSPV